MIVITGASGVLLISSSNPRYRMWAGIIGIIGQPFWITTSYINDQYGIMFLVLIYGYGWYKAIVNNHNELTKPVVV